ncbi:MAG: glycosyltransferase family 2 protein, partial [Proteobacteria bacterium]|nr:glycosyltransferase family 2 protein [Pseudomonadota bacterium]
MQDKSSIKRGLDWTKTAMGAFRDLACTWLNIEYDPPARRPISKLMTTVVSFGIRHLHGPKRIRCRPDEVIAVCVVKNGAEHIDTFTDHHFQLGVVHIVFLDNGSTDDTVEKASRYRNVTILGTRLPFKSYVKNFRTYLKSRFSKGNWCLCLDIDERFDYPYSDILGLGALTAYLRDRSYNAVLANMLDMFADKPLDVLAGRNDRPLEEEYEFYDLSGIIKEKIKTPAVVSNDNLREYRGGLSETAFG